ncbi:MAG TPA: leucyl/phenylalanyl-tRNA--protein transferase [Acidimicrobiales bacterium]
MPVEPPPSAWEFPPVDGADEDGLVGVGADLEPGTILTAYRQGLFPMPLGRRGPIGWWSPDPRAVIPLDGLRVSRSLRRSLRRFEVRVDTAFDAVVAACADPRRPHGWISPAVQAAYRRLHRLGWAHSVESWVAAGGEEHLAGGLYGVAIGGLFAGESMFHRRTDASKVALVGLVEILRAAGPPGRVLDVQWSTPHLASLGAVEVPRAGYLAMVAGAVDLPLPAAFAG